MTWTPPQPRADLIRLGVDFDGTLCESTWSLSNPTAVPGPPIWENVAKVIKLHRDGWKIWIHTSRASADYETIESWLNYHEVPFDGIETGKPLFYRYIDDRAVNAFDEEWV